MADDRHLKEAAAWFARLRAPGGEHEHARFQQWIDADPGHAAAYARVSRHWRQAAVLERSPLRTTSPLMLPWWRRWASPSGKLALGSAIAAVLLLVAWQHRQSPEAHMPAEIASAIGQLRTVSMPDGSRVTLDTDSAISVRYAQHERRIVLNRGRARFAVARDPHRTFIVTSRTATIVAHGTVFDVDLRPGRTAVSLIEGVVDVTVHHADAAGQRIMLAAGHRLLVADAPGSRPSTRPLSRADAGWPSGMLSFDAAPLGQVVAEANRYSTTRLVLADATLADLRVSGGFRAGDATELAAALAGAFALRVETRADGTILLVPTAATPRRTEGG